MISSKPGGKATLPPLADAQPIPLPPPLTASVEEVARAKTGASCHGQQAVGSGVIKDLRHMKPETHRAFKDVVLEGAMVGLGMGDFSDQFSEEDAEAIHAYLIARANEDWGE
jgi:quinohemoprotein ethanol dehydrogenase